MNEPAPEIAELRARAVVEMFERLKERLSPDIDRSREARVKRMERMIATLRLTIESLECDAADPKVQRLIRSLEKDIQRWEKLRSEWEGEGC